MFAVETPICLGTCLLWLLAPAQYLGGILGKRPHDVADYLLLQQSTAVVFSMFVYFYGRVVVSRRVDLRTFRDRQEAMALGDVIVARCDLGGARVPGASAGPAVRANGDGRAVARHPRPIPRPRACPCRRSGVRAPLRQWRLRW
ncbi:hypothetical protein AB0D27_28645 [Streptomyces sp. NPDC048415]|uniref:hypothetical protein n=1 Tax=Streptomyces sp. NPDC048415 TaxID=3154822 RepID=UPI003446ED94